MTSLRLISVLLLACASCKKEAKEDLVKTMKRLADDMCECPDDQCRSAIETKVENISEELGEKELSDSIKLALGPIVARMTNCALRESKPSEFESNLKAITEGAVVYVDKHRSDSSAPMFPDSVSRTPAGDVSCNKANPAEIDWSRWQDLRFQISKPFLGHYSFENKGTEAIARAEYDIDCDGTAAVVEVSLAINDDGVPMIGVFRTVTPD